MFSTPPLEALEKQPRNALYSLLDDYLIGEAKDNCQALKMIENHSLLKNCWLVDKIEPDRICKS